jgi:hypothetical protein
VKLADSPGPGAALREICLPATVTSSTTLCRFEATDEPVSGTSSE